MGYLFEYRGIYEKQLYEITTVPTKKHAPSWSKKHFIHHLAFHCRFV
jgi:hypothetical protein